MNIVTSSITFCKLNSAYIRNKKFKTRKDAKKEKEEDRKKKLDWLLKKEGLMVIQI